MMEESDAGNATTQVSDQTAPITTRTPQAAAQPPVTQRRGGWGRRLLFILLLLVVLVGLVVSGALLRTRLNAALGEVEGLSARLNDTQTELEQTRAALEQLQTDLDNTQAALDDMAGESARVRSELEAQMRYRLLLQQAQIDTAKAILSLTQDNSGQARREIAALRASLAAAAGLASAEDAATLADLEARASQAEADLDGNVFASQQTLEVIWRDLNALSASLLAE